MDEKFRHTNPEIDIHAMGEMHEHPTWKEYKWVALILGLITVVEVWVYYTPFKESSRTTSLQACRPSRTGLPVRRISLSTASPRKTTSLGTFTSYVPRWGWAGSDRRDA